MKLRPYYSVRTGRIEHEFDFDLEELRKLFFVTYHEFERRGFFQQYLGTNCVDGYFPGEMGDVQDYSFRRLRREGLFPLSDSKDRLSEDEIFDLLEFLFDHASTPKGEGYLHKWDGCGRHFDSFEPGTAREDFRDAINDFLRDYREGFELSSDGEILIYPGNEMALLVEASLPVDTAEAVSQKVEAAVRKFRRRTSNWDERRHAIRDLVDVLEYLRPKVKRVLSAKDESDLFNIANNFAIRHHNPHQKAEYDQPLWLTWMFYYYLATIHLCLRLEERGSSS